MSTPEERKEQGLLMQQLTDYICGDNESAKEYLNIFFSCLRIIDDVYDEDHEVSKENLMSVFEALFVKLPLNTFFQENYKTLFAQHVVIWNTWEISNILRADEKPHNRMYGQVLSGYCHELLPLVGLLLGGYNKMKELNGLIRIIYQGPLEEE